MHREWPQHVVYDLHLVYLTLAGEHGLRVDHLAHQTPDGPDVARLALGLAQKQFGCALPPRSHVLRLLRGFGSMPREPEVTYFQCVVRVDEDIFGFDVPVYDVIFVAVFDCFE